MVNLKDIAKKCNVSISTVSRVMRNEGYVSVEKKQLILKEVKSMGYIADENARALKKDKTKTIGIIISDVNNFFYNLILEKIVKNFKDKDYKVVVTYSFENPTIEKENFLYLLASRVEAVIFTPTSDENSDMIKIAKARGIIVLQLFRKAFADIGSLTVDDAYGAFLATNFLLESKCKNIVLLSVNVKHTPHRSSGYLEAYKEKGLIPNQNNIIKFSPNNSIKDAVKKIIEDIKPDGIIAGTNTFGMEVLEIFKELNIKKSEVKFVVFDDFNWLKLLDVCTIAQPIDAITTNVFNYIMNRILEENLPIENLKVTPKLIIRNEYQ